MRISILFVFTAVLLSACGGGATEEASPTPVQVATQPPTLMPADTPIVEPTVQPTAELDQPTAEPDQPTAEPAEPTDAPAAATDTPEPTSPPEPTAVPAATATDVPVPTATATAQAVAAGRVSFGNNLAVADQLVVTMSNVAPPPDGFVYEGWLIANGGATVITTGVLEVDADGRVDFVWSSPSGENLIAEYIGFHVTVEPADDSDPNPSDLTAFTADAAPDALAAARRVFSVNDGEPATPLNVSYGRGLLTQSQITKDHTANAFNAAAIGAFGEMLVHAEHVINIIEGTSGPRFADYNGDGRAENPGDGFGALAYARQMAALLPDAGADLSPVESLLIAVQDKAQEILASPDVATAQPLLTEFKALGEQLVVQVAPAFYSAAQAAVSYPTSAVP